VYVLLLVLIDELFEEDISHTVHQDYFSNGVSQWISSASAEKTHGGRLSDT